MEVRPGYKLTEGGVIPEDWDAVPITSVARLESGHTPSKRRPNYWNGAVQWVSLHDTDALDALEIYFTSKTITEDGLKNSSARLLPAGTVVFSRTATVGKCCVMAKEMATSQDFACYICGSRLDNFFLVYLFRGMGRVWHSLMAGSIHNTIYMPVFKALKIALPPFEEQHAIATALSDIDALLDGLSRLIAKKRNIKQAAMQQLLTGQVRLPGFGGEWEVKTVAQLGTVITGGTPSTNRSEFWNGSIPWVTPTDISESRDIFNSEREITDEGLRSIRALPENSVLVTCIASIGKNAILRVPGGCNQQINAIVPAKEVLPEFLYYLFEHNKSVLLTNAGATATSILSKAAFSRLTFSIPFFNEQTAIATVLSDMDAEITALETRLTKTHALKQAMMQELLTGKTRLI